MEHIADKINVPLISLNFPLQKNDDDIEDNPLYLEGGNGIQAVRHEDIEDQEGELKVEIPDLILEPSQNGLRAFRGWLHNSRKQLLLQ